MSDPTPPKPDPKPKPVVYINLQRVTMSGGKNKNKTFEPNSCRDPLEHLTPVQIQRLINAGVWRIA